MTSINARNPNVPSQSITVTNPSASIDPKVSATVLLNKRIEVEPAVIADLQGQDHCTAKKPHGGNSFFCSVTHRKRGAAKTSLRSLLHQQGNVCCPIPAICRMFICRLRALSSRTRLRLTQQRSPQSRRNS